MTPSTACYDLIKTFEQFRPTAYKPTPNDVWTLGWGHTHGVREGDTCTQATAQAWLEQDVAGAAAAVSKVRASPALKQNEFDALVSLVFNIGVGNFASSTLRRRLDVGIRALAASEFLRWDKQAGRTLPGLTRRREAERALFLKA